MNKSLVFLIVFAALVLVLFVLSFAPVPAQAEGRVCTAPGTGLAGALNMIADPTMKYTMDNHTNYHGDEGMHNAVVITACPPP